MRKKRYYADQTEKLEAFSDEILIVSISYDKEKGHYCVIEKMLK